MKPVTDISTDMPPVAAVGFRPARSADLYPLSAPVVSARLADFFALTKPRMNFLVLATTAVGYAMGTLDWSDKPRLIHALLGTALCAGAAAALNMWLEADHDRRMPRTRRRPLPAGRLKPGDALGFGLALAAGGTVYLASSVNLLTAIIGAATIGLYVGVYTPLKRVTTLNTVIGAVPGALPPVMGYTAATGHLLTPEAAALFAILFLWQMPHFLAIAVLHKQDYAAAGFKMLPVVDEDLSVTGRQVVLYGAALVPVSMVPAVLGMTGMAYAAAAVVLGLGFLWTGVACARSKARPDARRLFFASIIYLPVLLAVMMMDRS